MFHRRTFQKKLRSVNTLFIVAMCDMYQDFENTLDELGDVSGSEFEIPEHFDDQVVFF